MKDPFFMLLPISTLQNWTAQDWQNAAQAVESAQASEERRELLVTTIGLVIGTVIWGLPSWIAFGRSHRYRWVILVLTVTGPVTFWVSWVIALAWAVWPSKT
jgi:uncharacterized protein YacL